MLVCLFWGSVFCHLGNKCQLPIHTFAQTRRCRADFLRVNHGRFYMTISSLTFAAGSCKGEREGIALGNRRRYGRGDDGDGD